MPKPSSAFAGIKLAEETLPSETGLDQRLFSPPTPQQTPKPEKTEETLEVGKEDNRQIGRATSQPENREGGQLFDLDERPYRKDSFLFTIEEFEALEDLKLDLRRKHDLKTTKTDLARCALQHLIEDYRKCGEASIVVRRLSNRKAR